MTSNQLCPACFEDKGNAQRCLRCGFDEAAPPSALVLAPGTVLNGKFLIGKVLGKPGGFGVTYLAWDPRLEIRVAIKEFLPRDLVARGHDGITVRSHSHDDFDSFRTGLAQFLQEARTLARFDHGNVVKVRDFFEEFGTAYLVMDYYEGMTLGDYVRQQPNGRLEEGLAIDIMVPVLDGLADVHAKGFLHRDIKPANIYLTVGGRPILLDFGAAKEAASDRSRTMTVLTPGFAPWEQYRQGGVKHPTTDIYACGATLYYLISGEIPPEAPSRTVDDQIVPLHELVDGCSLNVSEAVSWAMQVHPQSRPQSVEEFQDALVGLSVPKPPQPPKKPGPSQTQPPQRKPPETPVPDAPPAAEALALTPSRATISAIGDTQRLEAKVLVSGGQILKGAQVSWRSARPDIATVDTNGTVRAIAAGVAEIEASHEELQASVEVTVEQAPTTVVISPGKLSFGGPEESAQLKVEILDRNRNQIAGLHASWTSADNNVATVNEAGLVQATGRGTTEIGVFAGTLRGSVKVAVKRGADGGDVESPRHGGDSRKSLVPAAVAAVILLPLLAFGLSRMGSQPEEVVTGPPIVDPVDSMRVAPTLQGAVPASPELPDGASARLRLLGTLPAGAQVTLDGRPVSAPLLQLEPGISQRVVVRAPGYEPASRDFVLAAGAQGSWSPVLRSLQATPPNADPAAEIAGVRRAVSGLVGVLNSGTVSGIRAAYDTPDEGELAAWEILLETFPNRSATLASTSPPQIQGDRATVDFRVNLTTRGADGSSRTEPLAVRGALVRSAGSWKFSSLLYGL